MLDIKKWNSRGITRAKSAWSAPALVVALLLAADPAAAQECETDADCGFGFQCYSDTLVSTTTTTGGSPTDGSGGTEPNDSTGGSEAPVCGDSLCEYGETWEDCAADCERYTYCAGAACEANADCAEGYQCQAGGGNTGSGGSTAGSVCGDGMCDSSETESCESDCVPKCQQVFDTCETDADCSAGYFCDFSQGVSSVGVTSAGSDPIYQYLGLCALEGTTGGTTGAAGEGGGSSSGSSAESSNTGSPAATSADPTGGTSAGDGGPGIGGSSGSGSNGNGNGSGGNGNGNGSGHGNSGGWPHWPKPGHGCSVGSVAAPGGAGAVLFALSAALGWVATRRRRIV